MPADALFPSFFLGGFECSTHRLPTGKRLDLIAGTGHDRHAAADYARLRDRGILAARDGVRWHLVEPTPGQFNLEPVRVLARAARAAGVRVIWDLLHYGWPDDVDPFAASFPDRFARMAKAVAAVLAQESGETLWVSPVNEISFFAWAGGAVGIFNPFAQNRGDDFKRQLVRAAIAGSEAVWSADPGARLFHVDPVFHLVPPSDDPSHVQAAREYRVSQFQSWNILSGRAWPELGGHPKYLDVVGVNYYPWNQWTHIGEHAAGPVLTADDPRRRPFRDMLAEVYERYGRPLFIAETGTEGDDRAAWLTHVCDEVAAAVALGVPVQGICWYPILDFPGWDNERHCPSGLWGFADDAGGRPVDAALAGVLARQQERFSLLSPRAPRRE